MVVAQNREVEAEGLADHPAIRLSGELADSVHGNRQLRAILDVLAARIAEHRAGRGVDELRDAVAGCPQEEPQGAERVHGQVVLGVAERDRVLRRRQVEDAVDTGQVCSLRPVENVFGDELEARMVEHVRHVARRTESPDEVVDARDRVVAIEQRLAQVRADEPRPTGEDHVLGSQLDQLSHSARLRY